MKFFIGICIGLVTSYFASLFLESKSFSSSEKKNILTQETVTKEDKLKLEKSSTLQFKNNIVVFYDGKYAFDSGEGNIGTIIKNVKFNESGEFIKADAIVVPEGAVLIAIKEYYTLGYYIGKIKIEKSDGEIEKLQKIFFSFSNDLKEIEYMYPNKNNELKQFAGEDIKGKVIFE